MNDKKIISRGLAIELSLLSNGVALVTFDSTDSRVNLLSSSVIGELEQVLVHLETPGFCKGVVFTSGKPNCFIAGADIKEIMHAQEAHVPEVAVYSACERGKNLLARIEALPLPTVAAIHGRCLGGGAELTLVCKTRLASSDRSTVIGLPEVGLGVLPGWGGTVRSPKMVGLLAAITLVLVPLRPWTAKKALRNGLVSAVLPPEKLLDAAVSTALSANALPAKPTFGARLLRSVSNSWLGRNLVLSLAGLVIKLFFGKKYPAPLAVLTVLRAALELPEDDAFELESRTFARLCKTAASHRCVQKFLQHQQAKKASKSAAH